MKRIISLILKLLVFIFMVMGITLRFLDNSSMLADNNPFLYFTIQSNLWIGLMSLFLFVIMIIEVVKHKKLYSRTLSILKYVFTVSITITGFIYCVALAPGMGDDAWTLTNVITHAVVPGLAIIDFLIYETKFEFKKKDLLWSLVPPSYYLVFASIGYICNWDFGNGNNYPYFFLNWGSPVGAFGVDFNTDSPYFLGVFYWILILASFVLLFAYTYFFLCKWINSGSKKRKKFDISDEFELISWFKTPLWKWASIIFNPILRLLPKGIRSDKKCEVKKIYIPTLDNKRIVAYVIIPQHLKNKKPCLVYYHGGAFYYEAGTYNYKHAREYAINGDCVVVHVRYRLYPKYKHPYGLEDAYCAYKYVLEHLDDYGLDGSRVAIGGDSAGGFLSSNLVYKIKENNLPLPYFVFLIYPAIDNKMDGESMIKYLSTPVWNGTLNKKMWKEYLGGYELSSIREKDDLSSYPPTYIETAEYDALKDEAISFGELLKENGVRVVVYNTSKTIHGFDFVTTSPIVKKSIKVRCEFLKKTFNN